MARRAWEITRLAVSQIEESIEAVEGDLGDLASLIEMGGRAGIDREMVRSTVERFGDAHIRDVAAVVLRTAQETIASIDHHDGSRAISEAEKEAGYDGAVRRYKEIACAGGLCIPISAGGQYGGSPFSIDVHYRVSRVLQSIRDRLPFAEDVVYTVVDESAIIRCHRDRSLEGEELQVVTDAPVISSPAGDGLYVYRGGTHFVSWRRSDATGFTFLAIARRGIVLDTLVKYVLSAIGFTIFIAICATLVVFRFSRSLTRSLVTIEHGVKEFAAGNLDTRIEARSRDELGRLAESFNSMAGEISRQQEQIEHAHAERLRSERLVTIGTFTAIVAHELKNPLGAIKVSSAVLREKMSGDDEGRRMAEIITDEVERMDSKLLRVLGYARPAPPQLAPHVIGDVVERAVRYAERGLGAAGIRILHDRHPIQGRVRLDADQIHQVLVNLINNAREAIRARGGSIRLESGRSELSQWEETVGLIPLITVSDDGPGIPQVFLAKIFEPFATTKAGGSGLGLAICRQIMQAHGGEIRVRSGAGGEGTQFALYFPGSSLEE